MRGADLDAASLIRYLKPVVVGQDPLDRERLWQALWQRNRVTTIRAIGAVDVALWDLGGKIAGLPIHRLLGSYRETIPAYASSAVLPTAQEYAAEAARLQAEGWTAYKIHPPTDPAVDRVAGAGQWEHRARARDPRRSSLRDGHKRKSADRPVRRFPERRVLCLYRFAS